MAPSRTFLFHGYALGFGAAFRRPFYSSIPSQASAVVSIGGGYACERVGPSKFCNGVEFEEASSVVTGGPGEDPDSWITIAKSTVRNLKLLDYGLFAEELHCQLTSLHDGRSEEPHITAKGSYIRGLHIGGVAIHADKFLDLPDTDQGIRESYRSKGEWAQHVRRTCNWERPADPDAVHRELVNLYGPSWEADPAQPPTFNGRMMLSIFDGLNAIEPTDQIAVMGNTVTLKDVGRFHLGELLVERGNRRLSMLRFSLGSDTEGQGSGAHSGTNGSPYP